MLIDLILISDTSKFILFSYSTSRYIRSQLSATVNKLEIHQSYENSKKEDLAVRPARLRDSKLSFSIH